MPEVLLQFLLYIGLHLGIGQFYRYSLNNLCLNVFKSIDPIPLSEQDATLRFDTKPRVN
jgi:hypothetical protein